MKIKEEVKVTYGALPSGTVLKDRYRIEKVLGRGGFGITYKAMDESLQVVVAIKEYVSEKVVKEDRGRKEAQIAATFYDLDGVVSIRDYFTENKTSYIVMDYVNGISVRKYIKQQGRMRGNDVLEQMRPILKSVIKIHDSGVVHRDISADNLMITREGRLLLIDFGAASLCKEEKDANTVIFKRGFAPIEQYRQDGKIGPWTDVYALCATMYFMITGMVPDDAMERWINDNCKSLDDIMGIGLSRSESGTIMKGIEVESKNRFQTVDELYSELYSGVKEEEKEIIFLTEKTSERTREGTTTLREEIRMLFGSGKKRVQDADENSKKRKVFSLRNFVIVAVAIITIVSGSVLWSMRDMLDKNEPDIINKPIVTEETHIINESVSSKQPENSSEINDAKETDNGGMLENNGNETDTKETKSNEKVESTKKPENNKKAESTKKPKKTDDKSTDSSSNKPVNTKKPTATRKPVNKEYDSDLDKLLQ